MYLLQGTSKNLLFLNLIRNFQYSAIGVFAGK